MIIVMHIYMLKKLYQSHQYHHRQQTQIITIKKYLKERNFRVDLFSRVIFFNISRRFNFANWLPVDLSRGFIFANLSFINVLYILIFSWFVLQLVVCESRNSYPNFSIFQIALLEYKGVNSQSNA